MFLFINTALEKKTVALIKNGKIVKKIDFKRKFGEAEKLLLLIDKLLKNNKIELKNLKGIVVVKGPGAFTSLRIGVAVANTLAYSLNIPVKGIKEALVSNSLIMKSKEKFSRPVLPFYIKEPNITMKNK